MMEIVSIGEAKRPGNEAAITFLEDLLERARSGEVIHVAVAVYNFDDTTSTGWSTASHVRLTTMLGAIEHLKLSFFAAQ